VNAFDYFRSGRALDPEWRTTPTQEATLTCPYGSKLNSATGRTECRSEAEALYTTGSGYVVRTSSDPAIMAKIAADAEAQGRARGLNITCKMIPMGGDLMNNNRQVYGTDCTVEGNPGQDAALLLTGSGFEIAAVEAARVAGSPMSTVPQFQASAGYPFLPPSAQVASPAGVTTDAPVGVMKTAPPAGPATGAAAAIPASAGAVASKVFSDISTVAEQAQAAISSAGIPTWVWLAGAGAAAFFLMKGKR
jgi:hypothetical protein